MKKKIGVKKTSKPDFKSEKKAPPKSAKPKPPVQSPPPFQAGGMY